MTRKSFISEILSAFLLIAGFCLVIAPAASARNHRTDAVPSWGNPGSCYYANNYGCWVLGWNHAADQGRTVCRVVDISYDPGHVGPFGYKRAAARDIANIAVGEGYQWAGGCYDNNNRDPTPNWTPRETKSTLGEGPDCSGLVWRVWRESNYPFPNDNSFYFWQRSTYDHGPYITDNFMVSASSGAPHVKIGKAGVIGMDAWVSHFHMALENVRTDSGADLVIEAKGESYGTNEFARTYRSDSAYTGARRLAWG
jgi:hypothetical protein